jgi:tRNA threonylcarbamoyladenosine dehydratase
MTIEPEELFSRNIMLYGRKGYERLRKNFVAVVGLGGVGSSAAEALARAGVARLRLIDCDVIKASDVNRQLIALAGNLGTPKVEAARERLLAINPGLTLDARQAFFHVETANELITPDLDFVVDAIDSLAPKAELIRHCTGRGISIVSALGAAGRTDPFRVRLARLGETSICPLARGLRRILHTKEIGTDLPVVYSTEPPVESREDGSAPVFETSGTYLRGRRRRSLPSLPTIPALFGLIAANHVILELLKDEGAPSAKP